MDGNNVATCARFVTLMEANLQIDTVLLRVIFVLYTEVLALGRLACGTRMADYKRSFLYVIRSLDILYTIACSTCKFLEVDWGIIFASETATN